MRLAIAATLAVIGIVAPAAYSAELNVTSVTRDYSGGASAPGDSGMLALSETGLGMLPRDCATASGGRVFTTGCGTAASAQVLSQSSTRWAFSFATGTSASYRVNSLSISGGGSGNATATVDFAATIDLTNETRAHLVYVTATNRPLGDGSGGTLDVGGTVSASLDSLPSGFLPFVANPGDSIPITVTMNSRSRRGVPTVGPAFRTVTDSDRQTLSLTVTLREITPGGCPGADLMEMQTILDGIVTQFEGFAQQIQDQNEPIIQGFADAGDRASASAAFTDSRRELLAEARRTSQLVLSMCVSCTTDLQRTGDTSGVLALRQSCIDARQRAGLKQSDVLTALSNARSPTSNIPPFAARMAVDFDQFAQRTARQYASLSSLYANSMSRIVANRTDLEGTATGTVSKTATIARDRLARVESVVRERLERYSGTAGLVSDVAASLQSANQIVDTAESDALQTIQDATP